MYVLNKENIYGMWWKRKWLSAYTMELLIVHGLSQIRTQLVDLSTKGMTYGSSIIPTVHFEPPKENLYKKQIT